MFQFHYGSIGSQAQLAAHTTTTEFQFHYGSIGRVDDALNYKN